MERWIGRVVLVTGASAGIGAAISRRLVEAGMKVVGAARNEERLQALARELANKPGSFTPVKCDISKDDDVLSLFATIKQKFGGVDVCINNAGMSHNHSLLEGTTEEWREMLDINVVGLCLCTRESVASMRARQVDDGQIIHISSILGHRVSSNPGNHFYTATKFAVTALLEGMRQELRDAKSHIRIAAISPGIVETEFAPRMLKSEEAGKKIYMNRMCLKADDIASSVIHVLSAPPHVQIHDILIQPTEQV
ncbi:dehydrogenase/reductase SDR family member 11 [Procambarus clarkii]|uniref:dehydrogenase/reductase SDR family member 11 n=1 Tax=Procambarus clarkii TaxID=6728 RepID=UPI001E678AAF|nr:dehydrogenase/reductase SDR family member 11-like [Procambarus clarkii]XP_045613495.1 dehydrogenase/reductase SDR family member 11-like [Procambarus clarkii]XP_045613497.1 dehydrogenase/reductase SDR family member 11-like [Procambarus clarkii]XP_045613498.1 dehydrogenase/reductase SDR family member 11-like [Procambarus clarkii]XP_045613499.1 dehydrogenase/reductase SDR family member 11-like [Procambarus clarkii]